MGRIKRAASLLLGVVLALLLPASFIKTTPTRWSFHLPLPDGVTGAESLAFDRRGQGVSSNRREGGSNQDWKGGIGVWEGEQSTGTSTDESRLLGRRVHTMFIPLCFVLYTAYKPNGDSSTHPTPSGPLWATHTHVAQAHS